MNPSDRKVLWTAGGIGLVLVFVSVLFTAGADVEIPTTYSAASGGARAAYQLLRETGYPVERWERSARDLPSDTGTTLIFAEPQGVATNDERAAIAQFIRGGGRVIGTGLSGAFLLPLHDVAPDSLGGMTWAHLTASSPSFVTRAAPVITMAPAAFWNADTFAIPLYGDAPGAGGTAANRLRVIQYNEGEGQVLWWASATPLTNAGLREPGNLEFFLASLGSAPRRILWDEYFHGHGGSASRSVTGSSVTWIGLQLAFVAVAVLLTYSRRSGPIVAPPVDTRLSPLEFVRTLGSLYGRAGAASVAVDVAYQRFRFQIAKRIGLRIDAPVDEVARAIRDRLHHDDPEVAALLRSCETARGDTALTADRALALTQSLSNLAAALKS